MNFVQWKKETQPKNEEWNGHGSMYLLLLIVKYQLLVDPCELCIDNLFAILSNNFSMLNFPSNAGWPKQKKEVQHQ